MMINKNNKMLDLYNGDMGIIVSFINDPTLYFMVKQNTRLVKEDGKVENGLSCRSGGQVRQTASAERHRGANNNDGRLWAVQKERKSGAHTCVGAKKQAYRADRQRWRGQSYTLADKSDGAAR